MTPSQDSPLSPSRRCYLFCCLAGFLVSATLMECFRAHQELRLFPIGSSWRRGCKAEDGGHGLWGRSTAWYRCSAARCTSPVPRASPYRALTSLQSETLAVVDNRIKHRYTPLPKIGKGEKEMHLQTSFGFISQIYQRPKQEIKSPRG